MLARLLDFLFPPRCPGCERPSADFCPACLEQLEPAQPPLLPELDEVRAVGIYAGPLKNAIRRVKAGGRLSLVAPLARLLQPPPGLLVPVPSPAWRRHLRGFNLAESLARALDRPWRNALSCPGGRREQKGLSRAARLKNRVFYPRASVHGPVVLVDDVLTTGTTLNSCARALRQAGACEVRAVVLAYQPDVHIAANTWPGRPGNL